MPASMYRGRRESARERDGEREGGRERGWKERREEKIEGGRRVGGMRVSLV